MEVDIVVDVDGNELEFTLKDIEPDISLTELRDKAIEHVTTMLEKCTIRVSYNIPE